MLSAARKFKNIKPYDGERVTALRWCTPLYQMTVEAKDIQPRERAPYGWMPHRPPAVIHSHKAPPQRGMEPSLAQKRLLASTYRRSLIAELLGDTSPPDLDMEIQALYARLRRLAREAEHDAAKEDQYQRALAHLRKLQRAEATALRAEKDALLGWEPGEARASLSRVSAVSWYHAGMPDISNISDREAISLYRFADHSGATTITCTLADQWYQLTHLLEPATPPVREEVGTLYSADPVGDEAVYTQYIGSYVMTLTARVSGGTLAQTTRLGLAIDHPGPFPLALAQVPELQRDISVPTANQVMGLSALLENVKPAKAPVLGTKLQVVLSSTNAGEVITILSLELLVQHIALNVAGAAR